MKIREFIRNTILRMDMLSATPTFRARRQAQFQTIVGGLLSLGIMFAFAAILYIQLTSMFGKLTITYAQGLSDDISNGNSLSDIKFAVSIDGVDLAASPKQFRFFLSQVELVPTNSTPIFQKRMIMLSPCQYTDWQDLGANFDKQFKAFGFDKMLCIDSHESVTLAGYIGSPVYKYLTFEIVQCNQTLDSSCDTSANIASFMTTYLTSSDYFNVRFFMVDTIITAANDQAITKVIEKNIFMAFTSTIGTVGYINMAEYSLQTDESYWPTTSISEVTGSYVEGFQTNSVSISSTRYVNLNIYKSTKSLSISRTIGKIDAVLSYVGGLFGLIFTAIVFFLSSYSDISYEIYVAESMLTFDEKGRKLKQGNFGFHTYLAYSIYGWLETFGIAPDCFPIMEDITNVREQICEQLDPVLMLKRIKHLEDMSKVLLNEHREMCMYLAQPMTLSEAKQMRLALTYYDKLIADIQCDKNNDISQQERKQSAVDDKMLPSEPNNIFFKANEDSLQQININREDQITQTEDEQQQRLMRRLREAVDRLEKDDSHVGQRIKEKISHFTRRWIMQLQSQQNDSSLIQIAPKQ